MPDRFPPHFGWLAFALAAIFRSRHDEALREINEIAMRIDQRSEVLTRASHGPTMADSLTDLAERLKA